MKNRVTICSQCGGPLTGSWFYDFCIACAHKQGLCSICKFNSLDTPGYKTCTRCRETSKRQADRIEARIGCRSVMSEWKVKQVEECKDIAAQLHEKFARKP